MFEGQETFAIGNDGTKRFNIHYKNKFVFAQEIEMSCRLSCHNLTMDAITLFK